MKIEVDGSSLTISQALLLLENGFAGDEVLARRAAGGALTNTLRIRTFEVNGDSSLLEILSRAGYGTDNVRVV